MFLAAHTADSVVLPRGTRVSVSLTALVDSRTVLRSYGAVDIPCEIAADVYDPDGTSLLIRRGTPVRIQVRALRGGAVDADEITFIPISTFAVDNRGIVFDATPVVFHGSESILRHRRSAVLLPGTSFSAIVANDYTFNPRP